MYEDLRYAIVFQAVRDYCYSKDYIKRHRVEYYEMLEEYPVPERAPYSVRNKLYKYRQCEYFIPECERFFRSDWFQALAPGFDGEVIIKRLKRMSYKKLKLLIKREVKE